MSQVAPSTTEAEAAQAMRLRPAPPQVMRLSRKALVIGGGLGACIGGGLLLFALQDSRPAVPATGELYRPATAPPEAVSTLPRDYTGPRLGPPLPGDLGHAMLKAQTDDGSSSWTDGGGGAAAAVETPAQDARRRAEELVAREDEAARTSSLFHGRERRETAPGETPDVIVRDAASAPSPGDVSAAGEMEVADLWPGTVLSGALVTGLRSDLAGPVLGQITEDVLDSRSGARIIIPRGSRLIGAYDAEIAHGQTRLRLTWSRLILPDGRIHRFDAAPASDPHGYAGLEDRVDNRWGERIRTAGLTTLLSVSAAAADGDDNDRLVRALRDGAGSGVDQVGRDVLAQGLAVPPRLTVRPGFPFRIILTEGLTLAPRGD
jgi:type IV secretory pathway VirB10-like protein